MRGRIAALRGLFMPLDLLRFVPFTPDMLDLVSGFDSGDEPHQQELAQWIVQDAVPSLARGTRIWLYFNQAGELVGLRFTGSHSLAVSRPRFSQGGSRHYPGSGYSQGILGQAGRAAGRALLVPDHVPPDPGSGRLAR